MRLDFRGIPEPSLDDPAYDASFSPDGRLLLTAHGGSIRIWELASGEVRWTLKAGAAGLAFSRDQTLLVSGGDDNSILLWDIRRIALDSKRAGEKLTPDQLQTLWGELAGKAQPAFMAQQRLSAAQAAIPFLAERLRPQQLDPERLAKLIAGLGASAFEARETAAAELRRLGPAAEERLRQALGDKPSAEVRRRVEDLLKQLDGPEPEWLRQLRSVELLEWIGTPQARQTLGEIAKNAPSLRLRQEADAAISRLEKNAVGTK